MTELIVILVGTILVNNFVLVRFLGLCPFLGVSRNLEAASGMSLATAFVLTLSSATAYLLHEYILVPLDLEYLRTISFILVIAASVQFTEIMVRRLSPLLHTGAGHLYSTHCQPIAPYSVLRCSTCSSQRALCNQFSLALAHPLVSRSFS